MKNECFRPENMGHKTPNNEGCGSNGIYINKHKRSVAADNLFQIQNQMCPVILGSDSPCTRQTWVRRMNSQTSTLQQRQDGSAVSSIFPPEIGLQMLQVE